MLGRLIERQEAEESGVVEKETGLQSVTLNVVPRMSLVRYQYLAHL